MDDKDFSYLFDDHEINKRQLFNTISKKLTSDLFYDVCNLCKHHDYDTKIYIIQGDNKNIWSLDDYEGKFKIYSDEDKIFFGYYDINLSLLTYEETRAIISETICLKPELIVNIDDYGCFITKSKDTRSCFYIDGDDIFPLFEKLLKIEAEKMLSLNKKKLIYSDTITINHYKSFNSNIFASYIEIYVDKIINKEIESNKIYFQNFITLIENIFEQRNIKVKICFDSKLIPYILFDKI